MFSMDSQGKVYLKEKLDYDKGLRFFDLKIEIEVSFLILFHFDYLNFNSEQTSCFRIVFPWNLSET